MNDPAKSFLVEGLDWSLLQNTSSLEEYITGRLAVPLRSEPKVQTDGRLLIQVANRKGMSVSETVKWLTDGAAIHKVRGQEINFSLKSEPRSYRDFCSMAAEDQPSKGSRQEKGGSANRTFLGRGRGLLAQKPTPRTEYAQYALGRGWGLARPQAVSSETGSSAAGTGIYVAPNRKHARRPGSGHTNHDSDHLTEEQYNPPSPKFSSLGPAEGLHVVTVTNLPRTATDEKLLQELHSKIQEAKGPSCNITIVHWTTGEAKAHISDIQALYALWSVRHKSKLKCDDRQLSWDVTISDSYEEDRILVERLPQGMTEDSLCNHLKKTSCIPQEVEVTPVFLKGRSDAIVFFSDTIAGNSLIEDLNKDWAFCEGQSNTGARLRYSLVPVPRSVRLEGLPATIGKGHVRSYISTLHARTSTITRPLLIEEITMKPDEGFSLVRLRTLEGCRALLDLQELPEIGLEKVRPSVKIDNPYPTSPSVLDGTLTRSDVKPVRIQVSDPVVLDFICYTAKRRRRLERHLDCNVKWDGLTLIIERPACSTVEYEKKVGEFSVDFEQNTLTVSDSRYWEKSSKYIERELNERNLEIQVYPKDDKSGYVFVGLVNEAVPFYNHCHDWLRKSDTDMRIVKKSLDVVSADHLRMLRNTPSFQDLPDSVKVTQRSSDNRMLDIEGPKKLVDETSEELQRELLGIKSVSYALNKHIASSVTMAELNQLYRDYKIDALVIEIREESMTFLTVDAAERNAKKLVESAYKCIPIDRIYCNQIRTGIRSDDYKEFVRTLRVQHSVKVHVDRDANRESYDEVRIYVTGKKAAAEKASLALTSFLQDSSVLTRSLQLEHPGYARYIKTYKREELETVKRSLEHDKADAQVETTSDLITLRATRKGLNLLQERVQQLVDSVKHYEKEVEKPGLHRFLCSRYFETERAKLEKTSRTIVYVNGNGVGESRPETGTSSKVAEYVVLNRVNSRIALYTGDICCHQVDAIVNFFTTEDLRHVGDLSQHILDSAGPAVQAECRQYVHERKKLPTGEAMHTKAGLLKTTSHVIHAVGPNCPLRPRDTTEIRTVERDLKLAVMSALDLASHLKCKSIAFPSNTSEVFPCPSEFVAKHMCQTLNEFLTDNSRTLLREFHFVSSTSDREDVHCFIKELERQEMANEYATPTIQQRREEGGLTDRKHFELQDESELSGLKTSLRPTSRRRVTVAVTYGDIVSENVDVIVNSTNTSLNLDSAMASNAVAIKAGKKLQAECSAFQQSHGDLSAGQTYTSKAYNLQCRHIVHVVCPNTQQGLAKAVEDCLIEASRLAARSVSFPALGTGRLGMNDDLAAISMFDGISSFLSKRSSSLQQVNIVLLDRTKMPTFKRERQERLGVNSLSVVDDLGHRGWLPNGGNSSSGTAFQKVVRVFRSFGRKVGSLFSSRPTGAEKDRRGPAMQTFERERDDVVSVSVFGANSAACTSTHSRLLAVINEYCLSTPVDVDIPKGLDLSKMDKIAANSGVELRVVEKSWYRRRSTIIFSGYKDDIAEVHRKVIQFIGARWEDVEDTPRDDGIPLHWFDPGHEYTVWRHILKPDDDEFELVRKKFVDTKGHGKILSIERIQNPELYRGYIMQRQSIDKHRRYQFQSGKGQMEIQGFHGTSSTAADQIASNGFNRALAGSARGKLFGAGVYFASKAGDASRYAPAERNEEKTMFYCDVLVGLYTKGDPSMIEPPPIDPSINATDRYDSTVNDTSNPSIFVSCYRDYMAYPKYLITFR